jgi:P27 family predicted phage terminase small subunit
MKPPKHLSSEAKKIWRSLTTEFDLCDMAGQKILAAALEAFDRAAAARQAIDRDGMTVLDKSNQIKPHPLLACERDSRAAFLAGLKALNLDLEPVKNGPGRPSGRS